MDDNLKAQVSELQYCAKMLLANKRYCEVQICTGMVSRVNNKTYSPLTCLTYLSRDSFNIKKEKVA